MVEGLRSVKPWNQPRGLLRFLTACAAAGSDHKMTVSQ
jgi:hypothetical protein